jgi:hypothetical protein
MNVNKLNNCMTLLKGDLGDGLIAASILSLADAQPLVTIGSTKSGAAAMSCEVTNYLRKALELGYPPLRRFYYLDLANDVGVLILPYGDYQWAIAVNSEKTKLGLLLNVVLPKILAAFEDAIKSE